MAYLVNNPEIMNRSAREFTGIRSKNTMKNAFRKLEERRLIEPVPGKTQGSVLLGGGCRTDPSSAANAP